MPVSLFGVGRELRLGRARIEHVELAVLARSSRASRAWPRLRLVEAVARGRGS